MVAQMRRRTAMIDGQRRIGERLAQFGAVLARNGEQFRLVIDGKRADEGDMLALADAPPLARCDTAAQFDRRIAACPRLILGSSSQGGDHGRIIGQYATIDGEGGGHQRLTEQAATHMLERQQAANLARWRDRREHQRPVRGRPLDRDQPGRAMEGRAGAMGQHIGICRLRLCGIGKVQRGDRQIGPIARDHAARAASCATSASTRVQAKSWVRRRSLAAMTDKLV